MFTRFGMQLYTECLFLGGMTGGNSSGMLEAGRFEGQRRELLEGTDLEAALRDELDDEVLKEVVDRTKGSVQWWAFVAVGFCTLLREAIEGGEATTVAWAAAGVERARSMMLYKMHFEEVVFMGQSARKIIDILYVWDNNKRNDDESFWQNTFSNNSYAISQVFAVPIVFIGEEAYIGGMRVDRKNAKYVDCYYSVESSKQAVLVEIKSPCKKLIGKKYRNTYSPSTELSGSIMQVLDYRRTFLRHFPEVRVAGGADTDFCPPRCALIIGDASQELVDPEKKVAFEAFRANSREVEVVTYDEIFRKLEVLASLFGLRRRGDES